MQLTCNSPQYIFSSSTYTHCQIVLCHASLSSDLLPGFPVSAPAIDNLPALSATLPHVVNLWYVPDHKFNMPPLLDCLPVWPDFWFSSWTFASPDQTFCQASCSHVSFWLIKTFSCSSTLCLLVLHLGSYQPQLHTGSLNIWGHVISSNENGVLCFDRGGSTILGLGLEKLIKKYAFTAVSKLMLC